MRCNYYVKSNGDKPLTDMDIINGSKWLMELVIIPQNDLDATDKLNESTERRVQVDRKLAEWIFGRKYVEDERLFVMIQ